MLELDQKPEADQNSKRMLGPQKTIWSISIFEEHPDLRDYIPEIIVMMLKRPPSETRPMYAPFSSILLVRISPNARTRKAKEKRVVPST